MFGHFTTCMKGLKRAIGKKVQHKKDYYTKRAIWKCCRLKKVQQEKSAT